MAEQPPPRPEPEFDFWDFVGCAVCNLPFAPPDGRGPHPVPFWITECGHVLCNAHLDPNQSCARCGDRGVQLVPLQRNIDPPMSDWFRSLPHAIDGIAGAVKMQFQQDSLAALVRHYRTQCMQLSSTCDRLRNERRSLRKEVDALRRQLQLSRSRAFPPDHARDSSAHMNHNGKRPMVEIPGSIKTNSSPRSIPTPVGPLRLTLPPGEHPTFIRQDPSGQEFANVIDKPGSSRFAEHFAYHAEDTARVRPPQPAGEQQPATLRQSQFDSSHAMMAPPPPPTHGKRFKPVAGQVDQRMEIPTLQNLEPQRIPKISESMGPPSTPLRPFSAALRTPSRLPTQSASFRAPSNLPTNRFVPSSSHGRAFSGPTPTTTPAATAPGGDVGRAPGGNRMPFVPQNSRGFG